MNLNRKTISGAVLTGMLAVATTLSSSSLLEIEGAARSAGRTAGVVADIGRIALGETTTAKQVLIKKAEVKQAAAVSGAFRELGESFTEAASESEELAPILAGQSAAETNEGVLTTETVAAEILETEQVDVVPAEEAAPEEITERAIIEEEVTPSPEVVIEDNRSEEEKVWDTKLMPTVEESLNIRAEASEEADVVGKLYAGASADILERGPEWSHIVSGDVEGYVKNEFCVFGQDAYNYAKEVCPVVAEITTDALRFRTDADEEAAVISTLEKGTSLYVSPENEEDTEWLYVSYDGEDGYVSSDYVEVSLDVKDAISIEEEEARIAAEQAEAAKSSQAPATGQKTNNGGVAAAADDVALLGALIQCEAGNECYEGQVAVGAVVMNRLRSGAYGGSISSVIYAPGQFSPAGSGQVGAVLASGVKGSCIQAAQEALAGVSNVGGCTCFRNVSCGHAGTVIGNHVFW